MTATANYSKIFRNDMAHWSGNGLGVSRRDNIGEFHGLRFGDTVDVAAIFAKSASSLNASTIQKAIDHVGSKDVSLLFAPGNWQIDANITFPANVSITVPHGAKLIVQTGKTLTINGAINAGIWQIIDNNGTIAGAPLNTVTHPEWFGAKRDGSTDDASAINDAIDLVDANGGTIAYIPGTYIIGSSLDLESNVDHVGS